MQVGKNKFRIIAIIVLIILGVFYFLIFPQIKNQIKDKDEESGIEHNYGISHVTTNININGDANTDSSTYNAARVVPKKDDLVKNLNDKGYKVTDEMVTMEAGLEVNQVKATKGDSFVLIVYCQSEEVATAVLSVPGEADSSIDTSEGKGMYSILGEEYTEDEFYLLARNENFVYCISDKKSFKAAGFTSLANSGVQIINHSNK